MSADERERHRLRMRKWRAENPERALEIARRSARKRRAENPERFREYSRIYNRKWRVTNRGKVREVNRKHRLNRFGAIRPRPATCECCSKPKPLQMDHDHFLGTFRGWICSGCNTSIGKLGDDIAGVQRALDYLQRNNSL